MKITSWRGSALSIVCALALQACGGGGGGDKADPVVTPSDSKTQTVASGTPAQLSIAAGGVLQAGDASAQVSLPANAMVDALTGAPVTGEVTVTLSTVNPAADPHDMAEGSYQAIKPGTDGTETELIESFGAITVTLQQGDRQLQLAPGQTATIRIPVQSRSNERPATMPLYFWDEALRIWIQEGSATLKRDPATNKEYYEGTVSHFTTWNADKPIEESVKVTGCVQATPGVPAPANAFEVYTDGQDYSGLAWGSNTEGRFTVLAKKGGTAVLHVIGQDKEQTQDLGVLNADIDIKTCFVLNAAGNSTAQAFFDLITTLTSTYQLVAQSASAVDVGLGEMLAPAAVCQSGSVSGVTLDTKAVAGGEQVTEGKPHNITTTFKQCLPNPSSGDEGSTNTGVLDGQATMSVTYTGSYDTTLNISATSVLNALSLADSASDEHIVGNGTYGAVVVSTPLLDSTTITPQLNAQLTNVATGRTLSFTGGSHQISIDVNALGSLVSRTLQLKQLGYRLQGATYVLDGTLLNDQGTVTLSKNGQVVATLTATSKGASVSGVVDPF